MIEPSPPRGRGEPSHEKGSTMTLHLASGWWSLVLRGAAAIILGLVALIFPPTAVAALVALFGAYALVDGVVNLVAALRAPRGGPWGWLAFEGVVSVACGLLTLFWPGVTALALVLVIGFWSVFTGIAEIVAAVLLRKQIEHEWLLGLSGLLSVAFGVLLFLAPAVGLVVIALWMAAYALVFGAVLVALGLKLRAWGRALEGEGIESPRHA
jgi:uncharacterized membrane protein HdeD (DUF308 family)